MKCPRCGQTCQPDETECSHCGVDFEDAPKTCPKCGCQNAGQALECLRCGIIFDRYEAYLEKRRRAEEETNQTTDSLLDHETLKIAAEASRQHLAAPVYARTACPHCAQRYKIRTDQVGILTRCKKCSSIFKIDLLPDIETRLS